MKIKLIRSKPKKTESGIYYDEAHEYLGFSKCFEPQKEKSECAADKEKAPEKCNVITIPLKRHIHPCYEKLLDCYTGGFYKLKKGDEMYPEQGECKDC